MTVMECSVRKVLMIQRALIVASITIVLKARRSLIDLGILVGTEMKVTQMMKQQMAA